MSRFFNQMKISQRIAFLLHISLVLMIAIAMIGLWEINSIDVDIASLAKSNIPLMTALNKIALLSTEQRIQFNDAVQQGRFMAQDATARDRFEAKRTNFIEQGQIVAQEIERSRICLKDLMEVYPIRQGGERIQKIDYELRSMSKTHADYEFAAKRTLNLFSLGKIEQARETLEKIKEVQWQNVGQGLFNNLFLAIDEFIQASTIAAGKSKQFAMIRIALYGMLMMAIVYVMGSLISKSIIRPLHTAVTIANQIASGYRHVLIETNARDETGQLLQTMENMSKAIDEKEMALMQINLEQKKTEEQIRHALAEKEVLLREIHHRVKNNMQVVSSLLTLQSRTLPDSDQKQVFQDCRERIKCMGLIHERLYQSGDLQYLHVQDYIRELTRSLSMTFGRSDINLDLEIDDIRLDLDTAIPCGLLVNELITNCYKHAFPEDRGGAIRLTLRETVPHQVELIVSDNGSGIPEDLDIHTLSSVGMRLAVALAENQLAGSIKAERENGTRFHIVFKSKG